MKHPFFVFEGIDGSGKSTQLEHIESYLKNKGLDVLKTFEPTDSKIGKLLRQGLSKKEDFSEETLALLFAADRLEHIKAIKEAQKTQIVLSDRYLYSSLSYNATLLDKAWIKNINRYATLKPDCTFLFDLPVELALSRIQKRSRKKEVFENQSRLEAVRNAYLDYAKKDKDIYIIDAGQSQNDIFETLCALIENYL